PSQAKVDKPESSGPPPSPNPLGTIKGAPISGNRKPPQLPPGASGGYGYPPPQAVQGAGYPQGMPAQGGYPPQAAASGYGQMPPQQGGGYPGENMIPDFGKPLPRDVVTPGANAPNYGNGFLTGVQAPSGDGSSMDEQRLTRLEQTAFGS